MLWSTSSQSQWITAVYLNVLLLPEVWSLHCFMSSSCLTHAAIFGAQLQCVLTLLKHRAAITEEQLSRILAALPQVDDTVVSS